MKVLDWLLSGDVVIQQLTHKYLMETTFSHQNGGFIGRYLELFDRKAQLWGDSVYNKKWISSTYTLLELVDMEITPDHLFYQKGTQKVLDELWYNQGMIYKNRYQDLCMSAMVLKLVCYGKFADERINEIVDFLLEHQMSDGGWNCAWDSIHNRSIRGSFHTTITVLEGFSTYIKADYHYRLSEIEQQVVLAQEYLLKRQLFNSLQTGEPAHPEMLKCHYPYRWKYDCFRGLEYFVKNNHPYDERMAEAIDIVKGSLKNGAINKGKKYSGKTHFPLENGRKGRFNTYRGLRILKQYDYQAYHRIISSDYNFN